MRKFLCLLTSFCLFISIFMSIIRPVSAAQTEIKISVDGKKINPPQDQKPYISNSRTMVSIKILADALKLPVAWNGNTSTVTVKYSYCGASFKILLTIGSKTMIKEKIYNQEKTTQQIKLDIAPTIKNSRTYLPVGLITQSIEYLDTSWEANTRTVKIDSKQIKILVNSNKVNPPADQKPFISNNNRTMVSIKNLGDVLKMPVAWNAQNSTVTVSYTYPGASCKLCLTIGSKQLIKYITYAGKTIIEKIDLDTAPIIKFNRTYIPLSFITKSIEFLQPAEWDGNTDTVIINTKTQDVSSDFVFAVKSNGEILMINSKDSWIHIKNCYLKNNTAYMSLKEFVYLINPNCTIDITTEILNNITAQNKFFSKLLGKNLNNKFFDNEEIKNGDIYLPVKNIAGIYSLKGTEFSDKGLFKEIFENSNFSFKIDNKTSTQNSTVNTEDETVCENISYSINGKANTKTLYLPFKNTVKKIPIILYHHFVLGNESLDTGSSLIMPSEKLEKELKQIKAAGFQTVTFGDIYDFLLIYKELPSNSIMITADDGYKSNYDILYPLLKKYNLKSVFFTNTKYIGLSPDNRPHYNWDQAREMQNSGLVEIQSHGYDHIDYTTLPVKDAVNLINESENLIEKNLGKHKMRVFAYPGGCYTSNLQKALTPYFQALCTTSVNGNMIDYFYTLPRITISSYQSADGIVDLIKKYF